MPARAEYPRQGRSPLIFFGHHPDETPPAARISRCPAPQSGEAPLGLRRVGEFAPDEIELPFKARE